MAETAAVLGLVSAVVQLVDFGTKVIDRLNDFTSAANDVPQSFRAIKAQLPLFVTTLQLVESQAKVGRIDAAAAKALRPVVDSSLYHTQILITTLEKIMPAGNFSTFQKRLQALKSLAYDDKVQKSLNQLQSNIQLLVFHQTTNQVEIGEQIVRELSRLSLAPLEKPSPNYSFGLNLGNAPQIDQGTFVGREVELNKLKEWLAPQSSPPGQNVVSIAGTGGIGKTQLSVTFAKRNHERYSSMFWLNAKDEAALKRSFVMMSEIIFGSKPDSGAGNPANEEQVVRHLRRWLSEQGNSEWLIVFDNYDDPNQPGVKSSTGFDIRRFFPHRSQGSILITTRSHRLAFTKQLVLLKFVDLDQSLAVLASRSRRNVQDDPDGVRLAKRLDGLPLALATAGMYLSQTSEGLSGYLDAYEENWHELSDDAEELLDYEGRTLFSTWNLSFMHVQSQDPDAAECLRLLAYFGNLEIWYDLFRVKFRDGIPWLSRVTENKRRFERAMARLHDYSLVEISAESYSLHSCVHDWTLHILNRNISKVYCRVALRCIAGNVMSASEKDYWQNNQRLVHHAKRLEHSRLSQTLDDEALDESYAGDLNYLGILWALQGELGKAEKIYQRALAGCETALGAEHMSTINIINNLGLLYRDQRKLAEAEKMFHRALVGYETALGAENTWILNTFNNLGLVYIDQGKLTEAEKMLHQALTGKEMAFGAEHTSTLNTIHHLGMMYRDQGKLAEAEKMLHQALIGYETRLGAEHAWMLDTIHTLGLVYRDQGKLTEAEKMLHQALRGYETTLGAEHTSTLHTLNNLGVLYTDQGKLAEAEKMYRRSLTGYETALGAEHTSTLRTLNNLGFLYRDQGKLKETEKMYRRSLAGCGTALGAEHMSTLAAVNDLISVLLQRYWEQLFQSEGPIGNQSPILIDIIKLAQEWAGRSPKAFKALGRALLWISDEQNAQIAFQQQLKLQEAPSHHADAHCDGCRLLLDYSMTRFICKHCRDVDACKDCYVKHETGVEKLATCSNHAFLEVSLEELSKANGIKHLGETGRDLWVQHLLTKYYQ